MRLHKFQKQSGFTLVELIVAMSIFVTTILVVLNVYSNILKLNRRAESYRQANQTMRNFMEALVKDIRNSKIDYDDYSEQTENVLREYWDNGSGPCANIKKYVYQPGGVTQTSKQLNGYVHTGEKRLALYRQLENGTYEYLCYYLSDRNGTSKVNETSSTLDTEVNTLGGHHLALLKKVGKSSPYCALSSPCRGHVLNPDDAKIKIKYLNFFVYPSYSPYNTTVTGEGSFPGGAPNVQPFVVITAKFGLKVPGTTEEIIIPYQTTVSTEVYDLP